MSIKILDESEILIVCVYCCYDVVKGEQDNHLYCYDETR